MSRERLEVGAVLDRKYKLVRRLGEGGMGTVFEAEHLKIRGHVAIKVLHERLSRRGESVQRFVQEARAAGTIGHPGIVPVIDMGGLERGKRPYIVMELLRGANLSRLMAFYGPLNPETVACVVIDVLSALSAAHAQGIVHRDLKPDNVFVSIEAADVMAKVVDFGVSKFMHDSRTSGLTQTGTVMGTPTYMSPEQARGEKHLDGRVDVYAAGVIFYEALCGEPPFRSDNYNALLQQIIAAPVEPIRTRRADVSADLEAIIFRSMARDLGERFASADDMSAALSDVLDESSLRRARRGLHAAVAELPNEMPTPWSAQSGTLDDSIDGSTEDSGGAAAATRDSPGSTAPDGADEEPTSLFVRMGARIDDPDAPPPLAWPSPPLADDLDAVSGRFRTIRGLDDLDAPSSSIQTESANPTASAERRLAEELDAASGRVQIPSDESRARLLARRRSHPDLSAGRATFSPPLRTPESGQQLPRSSWPAPDPDTTVRRDRPSAPEMPRVAPAPPPLPALTNASDDDDDDADLLVLELDESPDES